MSGHLSKRSRQECSFSLVSLLLPQPNLFLTTLLFSSLPFISFFVLSFFSSLCFYISPHRFPSDSNLISNTQALFCAGCWVDVRNSQIAVCVMLGLLKRLVQQQALTFCYHVFILILFHTLI